MRLLILLFSGLLLAGCIATTSQDVSYSDYQGQQSDWPTRVSAFSHSVAGIAIYDLDQYPSQPYKVVGRLTVPQVYGYDSAPHIEHLVADACRLHKADAALLQQFKPVGHIAAGRLFWLIKFVPEEEGRLQKLDSFLLWADENRGGTTITNDGEAITYTAEQIARRRAEIIEERKTLLQRKQ